MSVLWGGEERENKRGVFCRSVVGSGGQLGYNFFNY